MEAVQWVAGSLGDGSSTVISREFKGLLHETFKSKCTVELTSCKQRSLKISYTHQPQYNKYRVNKIYELLQTELRFEKPWVMHRDSRITHSTIFH
jgi:hypothetical protein